MGTNHNQINQDLSDSYLCNDHVTKEDRNEILKAFREFRSQKTASQSKESKQKNQILRKKFLKEDHDRKK